jgi:hypothetical protein
MKRKKNKEEKRRNKRGRRKIKNGREDEAGRRRERERERERKSSPGDYQEDNLAWEYCKIKLLLAPSAQLPHS